MIKKIVISPDNKKAIAFLEDLNKRKEEFKRTLIEKATSRKERAIKIKH